MERGGLAALPHEFKEDRLYPLHLLTATAGMPRGELLALRWIDLGMGRAEFGIETSGIVEDPYGLNLSFRDPDNIALEVWSPPPSS